MSTDLLGKVVCITGAAGGIGRALSKAFAWEGADLALLDRDEAVLEELAAPLRMARLAVHTTVADLCTEQGVQEGMLCALAAYDGAIDILVPNVGVLIAGSCESFESGP